MRSCQSIQKSSTSRTPPLTARPSVASNAKGHLRDAQTVRFRPSPGHATQFPQCDRRPVSCKAGAEVLATAGAAGIAVCPEIRLVCQLASACVVIAACVRNVPQLLRCWREKSTEGISVTSLITEVTCYSAMIGYMSRSAYSPLIWGSEAACWVQDTSLLLMVAVLRKYPAAQTIAFGAVWIGLQSLMLSPFMPIWALAKFQILAGLVLGLGARIPQIVLNHRNGHTGNLVAATFIFNLTANVINGVCATVLTGDILVIATQAWMFSLNCTVVSQIWRSRRRAAAAESQKVPQHPSLEDSRVDGRVFQRVSYEGGSVSDAWPSMA